MKLNRLREHSGEIWLDTVSECSKVLKRKRTWSNSRFTRIIGTWLRNGKCREKNNFQVRRWWSASSEQIQKYGLQKNQATRSIYMEWLWHWKTWASNGSRFLLAQYCYRFFNLFLLIPAQVSFVICDNQDTTGTVDTTGQPQCNFSHWYYFQINMSCVVYLWCWQWNPHDR